MENKTIKFKDVPIGVKVKFKDGQEGIRVDDIHVCLFNPDSSVEIYSVLWNSAFYHSESEVELITKCSNCKHYASSLCINYPEALADHTDIQKQTFSCSLFEIKNLAEGE